MGPYALSCTRGWLINASDILQKWGLFPFPKGTAHVKNNCETSKYTWNINHGKFKILNKLIPNTCPRSRRSWSRIVKVLEVKTTKYQSIKLETWASPQRSHQAPKACMRRGQSTLSCDVRVKHSGWKIYRQYLTNNFYVDFMLKYYYSGLLGKIKYIIKINFIHFLL